ncbi:MAG: hypothetical protein ABEI99_08720 [Halobaculum sp.]
MPTAARVQSAVRRLQNVDHNAVDAGVVWYSFVTVDRELGSPDPTAFRLHTTASQYEPLAARGERHRRHQLSFVNGEAYGTDGARRGWLLFSVPYRDPVRDAVLTRGEHAWRLPTETVERLRATPPRFTVRDIVTPESPSPNEPFDVRLRIANDGGPGTFRGAFNYTAPLYYPQGFTAEFAGGENRTVPVTVTIHTDTGATELAAWLASPDGNDHEWRVTFG